MGFNVKNVAAKDLKRGCVVSYADNDPASHVVSFKAYLIFLNGFNKIYNGYTPTVDCHTCKVSCRINKILS